MRVVVTGGSGFIGSHVVEALRQSGHDVAVVDHLPPQREDVDWRAVDIGNVPALAEAFSGAAVVFHLAAVADVNVAFADPVETVDLNVTGTARVCEAARSAGVRRVVLASTVWVYGAAVDSEEALREDTAFDLGRPVHLYTASKIAAELVVRSYHELYGLEFTVLRYGIPYGERMRDSLVIPKFVQMALDGDPITLQGDGSQFRNYVYVGDLAKAHVDALDADAANEVFNLEGSEPVTIRALVDRIGEELGTPPTVTVVPSRSGDYNGRPVSAEKAAEQLGWRPTVGFGEGLRRYVAWHTTQRATNARRDAERIEARDTEDSTVGLDRWLGSDAVVPAIAVALLALPLGAAVGRNGPSALAAMTATLSAALGFAIARRTRLPRLLSGAVALLAIWLLSQTAEAIPLALVGVLLGMSIGGIGIPLARSLRTRLATGVITIVTISGLLVLSAVWPSTLFWVAALGTIAVLTAGSPQLHLPRLRLAGASAVFVGLALVTACTVGATSASAAWFGPVASHGPRGSPEVAITFHGEADAATLDALNDELILTGDRATFFVPGSELQANRTAVKRLLDSGNLLADYPSPSRSVAALNIDSGRVAAERSSFNAQLQICPRFVRPPNGVHTPLMAAAARSHGVRLVTWDQLVSDLDGPAPVAVAQAVAARSRPGSIIAFDLRGTRNDAGRRQLLEILPVVLQRMHQRGLRLVRVDQLLHDTPYVSAC